MALTYLLQKSFSNAQIFKGENRAVIVPRPHLDKFIEYLNQIKDKIDIGIFSTASSFLFIDCFIKRNSLGNR